MTLKTIRTHNIQSHRDVIIELPETGLIRFSGENSNGKSVITKLLCDIIYHNITQPSCRRSLITFGEQFGEATLTRYDGIELFYHIHSEAAQTYAELRIPGKDVYRRYLADKSIPLLRSKFGLHYDDISYRSLNVSDSDDALLFYKTPYKANYSIAMSAVRDKNAEASHDELERVYKETKKLCDTLHKGLDLVNAQLETIHLYDIEEEEDTRDSAARYANILRHLEPLGDLPELVEVPKVRFIKLPSLELPEFNIPRVITFGLKLDEDIVQLGIDLEEVKKGACPTCHRRFFS